MTDPADGQITVVVPTYNERANLRELIRALLALPLPDLRVLVVDDSSPDGTGDLADELALDSAGRMAVLHRTAKDGLGRAYVAGLTKAMDDGADVIVQMDADLSHCPQVIPVMVSELRASAAGVVIGSRYVPGGKTAPDWPWHRKALSVWANFYVNAILHLGVRDATAGFKAWRSSTLRAIDLPSIRSNGYSFQVEMNFRTTRAGIGIAEVPISFSDRAQGTSKMSLRVQLESAQTPWRLRLGRDRHQGRDSA
jgi:dolichol-phosphate mannosyltransferase